MALNVGKEVAALKRMTVTELRKKHVEVFGEPTRSGHKDYLVKRIAWRIQAQAEGGLPERARRRASCLPASRGASSCRYGRSRWNPRRRRGLDRRSSRLHRRASPRTPGARARTRGPTASRAGDGPVFGARKRRRPRECGEAPSDCCSVGQAVYRRPRCISRSIFSPCIFWKALLCSAVSTARASLSASLRTLRSFPLASARCS